MDGRRLPAGMRVKYQLGDGVVREGTVVKTVSGIGFSIIGLDGARKLVPASQVRAWP